MAFEREKAIQPSVIADIAIELFDPDPNGDESQTAVANIQVRMDDGQIRVRRVNLAEHLDVRVLEQLQALAAMIRVKAEAEILPAKALVVGQEAK